MTVNGQSQSHDVEPRTLLVHHIRENVGLTGTNIGCDTSSCGACTVHLDGQSVKSCTMLAVQAEGAVVTTIEGLADTARADKHAQSTAPTGPRPEVGDRVQVCVIEVGAIGARVEADGGHRGLLPKAELKRVSEDGVA